MVNDLIEGALETVVAAVTPIGAAESPKPKLVNVVTRYNQVVPLVGLVMLALVDETEVIRYQVAPLSRL
jgi:hypothetical protein